MYRETRTRRWPCTWLACLLFAALGAATAFASDVDRYVDQSLALCTAADRLPASERLQVLARGLDLADAAIALDTRSARAHFAVVCSLGKATELAGNGFGAMKAVYRLRREIDLTLALAPDHAEALAAKGALLVKLPRWLGGDRREAEVWLRRALTADPTNTTARTYLEELGATTTPIVAPITDSQLAP